MATRTFPQRLMAASLCLLLVSCSAPRPLVATQSPTGPHDLASYALLIQEMPDGRVTHTWKPLWEFDLTKLQRPLSAMSSNRGIVRASTAALEAYCEGRRIQCEQDCLASSRPVKVGHWIYQEAKTKPWREAKWRWCPTHCLEQAVQCNKGRGSWAEEYSAEFNAIEPAVDWLKTHREEILVGTVIVIAGVAFVAAVAASGGGALILTPLVFFAESPPGLPAAPPIAEATR
ncbi:hypothetical protein [Archangium lansingense]|uniref:Lipoprotein n=1 Tax=Archangium lansingense TaxID=2995310 RepID=A0ABT4ANG8_9BACT|nr:hypothetical protein [Archangium lansinium]MCY1083238.1 hypothetical protein [Archangium lansinium]